MTSRPCSSAGSRCESVLGNYDNDEAGDTTITDYGVYRIEDGELVCDETVRAAQ